MDVFGDALFDFYRSEFGEKLWLHNNYGAPEEMPVDVFFRNETDISELDEYALRLCKGRVLDIGAGVGAHSLILQARGSDITSLEISARACYIMKLRGLRKVICGDIFLENTKYDTLLLLMNGIGLCGDLAGLNILLPHLKNCLCEDGQILLDSSDISYLYEGESAPRANYYGEISYQYEYKAIKGPWFKWLYVDFDLLRSTAKSHGLDCTLVFEDDMDQYLARLTVIR